MDYFEEIVKILKRLDTHKLKCVYIFIRGMLD